MKRSLLVTSCVLTVALVALWAVGQLAQPRAPELPSLMPDGALLYLEAKDFSALLNDWNSSEQKRIWLAGDNYQAFSRSRLFQRLSQAQQEFSSAAGLATDNEFLSSVAGKQSCLGVYDIGNLAFVYVTRMDEHAAESTPLWQLRSSFEQRTEGSAQFFVRQDQQSGRTAAFAASNGWLILATREDLLAGVLDRLQTTGMRSVASESWFADPIKQASGPQGDLRMVLNLEKLVPSPYFRSYWVQRNITEMKQYSAALSDLYRAPESDREERVLLRKSGLPAAASGDVNALAALAPSDAVFYSAQASPDSGRVLSALRENLLELKLAPIEAPEDEAPPPVAQENAGDASMLEVRIDQAPVIVPQSDPYESLRAVLGAAQPSGLLQVFSTSVPADGDFLRIETGVVIQSEENWNDAAIRDALAAAIEPGLTAGRMGLGWSQRSGEFGSYFALDGRLPLFAAVRAKLLFLSNDSDFLESMLARQQNSTPGAPSGVTSAFVFRHSPREQQNFHELFTRLDETSMPANREQQAIPFSGDGAGRSPAFFSGNIASLSNMFSSMNEETVEEKDQDAKVTQTVVYRWSH